MSKRPVRWSERAEVSARKNLTKDIDFASIEARIIASQPDPHTANATACSVEGQLGMTVREAVEKLPRSRAMQVGFALCYLKGDELLEFLRTSR